MKKFVCIPLFILPCLLFADSPSLQVAYPELAKRNIFDSTRQPKRPQVKKVVVQQVAPTKREYLKLTGSLLRPDQSVAFFASSVAEMSGVKSEGDAVGTFRIEAISSSEVLLQAPDGTGFHLAIGESLSKTGDQPWQRSAAEPFTATAPAVQTQKEAPKDDVNEVMRRLMERRKKELNS
ncbi:hypothetical protein P0Y35_14805 [Kiritimatiellaeota bacterium B1221]|nr:hypothetical protein [Kiritimatiellaeota bacterium B1221]